ncbi:hypothetical protein GLN3_17360 (plasmid) [Geobacillus lituanicus]|nr:hypothetical protein GLN3_17175 [Geobacillus lituanicus]ASS88855.1 hypothetical protein GLN3_17360 [Geobacillus lituanicus]
MTEMPYLCWAFLYTSTGVNSYSNFIKDSKDIGKLLYLISFLLGFFAPLGVILSFFVFIYIISNFQIVNKELINQKIFSISIISYLPILAGSIVNFVLSIFIGVSPYGYTTAYGIFRPQDQTLISLTQELDPFKLLGVLLASYLYCKVFEKGKFSFLFMSISWYLINIIFIIILG